MPMKLNRTLTEEIFTAYLTAFNRFVMRPLPYNSRNPVTIGNRAARRLGSKPPRKPSMSA